MALNVPLTQNAGDPYPQPFNGESFLLTRDKIALSYKHGRTSCGPVKGRLFITNLRMVFLVTEGDRFKAQCESFEMPFRGLWDEKLNQPIFGTNNLSATLQFYDEQPFTGDLSFKLIFREGGCNTFLHMFNNVLRATRQQLQAERRLGGTPAPIAAPPSAPPVEDYMSGHGEAFVDPQDPSTIYTTQPAQLGDSRREATPAWSTVSKDGLRRRR